MSNLHKDYYRIMKQYNQIRYKNVILNSFLFFYIFLLYIAFFTTHCRLFDKKCMIV